MRHNKSCIIGATFWRNQDKKQIQRQLSKSRSWSTKQNEATYDLFAQHTIFHPLLYGLIETTEALSIVRYPSKQFVSSWNHAKGHWFYKMNLTQFIRQTYNNKRSEILIKSQFHPRWSLNSMCRILAPGAITGNDTYGNFEKIRNGKWIVLILERFDESLLVLKAAYNLEWTDLVYMKMKHDKAKDNDQYIESEEDEQKLLELNHCDLRLYGVAYQQFEQRLFQIYKGNETKIQEDIQRMNEVIKNEIMQCENTEFKSIYCQSLQKDSCSVWALWAKKVLRIKQ